ncbi:MAG: hypothetical protein ACPGVF_05860 [Flavobacteriaceae bacterium]
MNNQIMFGVGLLIFAIYLYFLLSIIWKQKRIQEKQNVLNPDSNDFDGMGNQGRIPNKKPKNRA